jgi:hypothetical protein
MLITIENDSQTLLELLWIREAWQLQPVGEDLPPRLVDAPSFVDGSKRASAAIERWQDSWPGMWEACLRHAGAPRDPGVLDRLQSPEIGSDERARLLRDFVGPSWRDTFGAEALPDEVQQWRHMMFQRGVDRAPRPFDEEPERVALDALISAWRSGLTTVVEIPCRGTFTRVVGAHALLVTSETRDDPERYREALNMFH